MPANSFQNALCPDGKYAVPAGELHLFDEGDRNTNWDINVNPTTSWVEHDLGPSATGSKRVPKGTKALWGFWSGQNTDAVGILMLRDGTSAIINVVKLQSVVFSGAGSYWGMMQIIKATDGIFDIKEKDATFEMTNILFNLRGYFL